MPTKTFQLNLMDGRPIIEDNGNVILIDTGSSHTFHSKSTFNFMNYAFKVEESTIKLDKLRQLLDSRITTWLGMDKLRYYKMVFDYPNKRITLSNKTDFSFEGENISFKPEKNMPLFEAAINQKTNLFLLDTGANLSFINSDETNDCKNVGKVSDYYPLIPWRIETEIYEIETIIGTRKFFARYGNLAPHFDSQLSKSGFGYYGIMGYELLKNYKIYIDILTYEFKVAESSPEDIQIDDDFEKELPDWLTAAAIKRNGSNQ